MAQTWLLPVETKTLKRDVPVLSTTRVLAEDPMSPVGCEVGPQQIGFVCSNWDLQNLETWPTRSRSLSLLMSRGS